MNSLERQREHFESVSNLYYRARQSENHLLYKNLLWSNFFSSRIRSLFGKSVLSVLEPMCGSTEGKKILERYLRNEIEYTGFDYSQNMIDLVKTRFSGINVFVQDITQFETTVEFDLVILIGGLHHVPEYIDEAMRRVFAALKSGGYFINFEPTHNNILLRRVREFIYSRNPLFDEKTERGFSLEELNAIYSRHGFEVVEQIYPGLAAYILYYNPDAFQWIDIGGSRTVRTFFALDRLFLRNILGRKFSFATLSLLQKA